MLWRWFFGIRLKTTLSTVCRVRTVDLNQISSLEQLFSTFRCFKNKYKSGRHSADALLQKVSRTQEGGCCLYEILTSFPGERGKPGNEIKISWKTRLEYYDNAVCWRELFPEFNQKT